MMETPVNRSGSGWKQTGTERIQTGPRRQATGLCAIASNKDRGIQGSSIATIEYNAGTWRNLKVLVPVRPSGHQCPSDVLPDSRFIAWRPSQWRIGQEPKHDFWRRRCRWIGSSCRACASQHSGQQSDARRTAADVANNMPTWAPTKTGETMFVGSLPRAPTAKVFAFLTSISRCGLRPSILRSIQPLGFQLSCVPVLPFQGDTEESHRPFLGRRCTCSPTATCARRWHHDVSSCQCGLHIGERPAAAASANDVGGKFHPILELASL